MYFTDVQQKLYFNQLCISYVEDKKDKEKQSLWQSWPTISYFKEQYSPDLIPHLLALSFLIPAN